MSYNPDNYIQHIVYIDISYQPLQQHPHLAAH